MAYILLLLFICFIWFITQRLEGKKRNKLFVILAYTTIAIFIILQQIIGPDYESYIKKYNNLSIVSWGEAFSSFTYLSIEPAFRFVCKIFSTLNVDPEIFLRIYMLMLITLFAIVCYKYSKNPFFFTVCFLCFLYKWVLLFRQATAVAIIMLGFKYVKEKKFLKFLLTIFLALNFHISSIVALLIYPFYNCKEKNIIFLRFFLVLLIIILVLFNEHIIYLCQEMISLIDPRYAKYFNHSDIAINMMLIITFFLLCEIFLLNKQIYENKIAINFILLVLFIQSLCYISNMAGRIIMCFYPIMFLSLERMFITYEDQENTGGVLILNKRCRVIFNALFISFILFFWWYTFIRFNPYILFI